MILWIAYLRTALVFEVNKSWAPSTGGQHDAIGEVSRSIFGLDAFTYAPVCIQQRLFESASAPKLYVSRGAVLVFL